MKNILILLITLTLGFTIDESTCISLKQYTDYRAVKYAIPIDYLTAHDLMGISDSNFNSSPKRVTAYKYFIQYGNDMIITILVPGVGMEFMGIIIKKWDFAKRKTELTHYLDHVRKYSVTLDSIAFAIEDSRGEATSLCIELSANTICDSVKIVSYSRDAEYTVKFADTIPNLTSHSLFYPDIKFLPIKIYGLGYNNTTLSLENIIYGKPSVDSLLQLFTFENYSLITDEDRNQISEQEVNDLIEEFDRATRTKH